ncbi:MAG: metal-dependent phosphohydrolase [Spirochaetota bacterium]|nr:metal-dependent phosphohydrolase [Spirochaetota bacterium]
MVSMSTPEKSIVLLRELLALDNSYIDACRLEQVNVICVDNADQKHKTMPFKTMYAGNKQFWLKNDTAEYFLSYEDFLKVEERASGIKAPVILSIANEADQAAKNDHTAQEAGAEQEINGYGQGYDFIAAMTETERASYIKESKNRLDEFIAQKQKDRQLVAEAMVESTQDAVLCNHATLMNIMNLSNDDAKKQSKDLILSTCDFVKSSSQLILENVYNEELKGALETKSNGTILQHMTRVYMNGLAFLSYYNKQVLTSSIINKLRISFKKYAPFYQNLLPHVENLTLEKVFLGGMRAIPENDFHDWVVGFLVHDIGKAAAVEYHESDAAFNREIVVEHVYVGYNAILNKTNYPRGASLIAGWHHEYYGDPSGYGSFRSLLEKHLKTNPDMKPAYCIAYDIKRMTTCEALAFFPVKMLEIVDVYDALTDPNRRYRKALAPQEALALMEEEFVRKNPKLDIILFDLFLKFMQEAN